MLRKIPCIVFSATFLAVALSLPCPSLAQDSTATTEPAEIAAALSAKAHKTEVAEIVARALLAQMREDLREVEDQIRNHPYLEALEQGDVSLDNLRAFAGEEYHIIRSDLRSDSLLVSRFGAGPASRSFFQGLVQGEIIALGLLLDFAAALGLDEGDLEAYEPRPGGQAFPAYVVSLASYGSAADVGAAFLVNFAVFGENTGRMSAALQSRYGFQAEEVAFFDFFATPIPGFEDAGVAVMVEGLLQGATPRSIRRAARLLQAYELLFWDAVSEEP